MTTTTRQREPVTEPAPHRRPIRRVAKYLGITLVVLTAAVAVWWLLAARDVVPTPPPITVTAPTTAPNTGNADSAAPTTGPAADGCLAGSDVLAAQHTAPPTPAGAAGFILTFARWMDLHPIPDDTQTVLNQTVSDLDLRGTLFASMIQFASTNPGVPSVTTVPGGADQWRATTVSAHTVTLDFTAYWHPVGATGQTGQARSYTTVTLTSNTAGHWVITGRSTTVPTDPWASIDAHPWQAYQGVC